MEANRKSQMLFPTVNAKDSVEFMWIYDTCILQIHLFAHQLFKWLKYIHSVYMSQYIYQCLIVDPFILHSVNLRKRTSARKRSALNKTHIIFIIHFISD